MERILVSIGPVGRYSLYGPLVVFSFKKTLFLSIIALFWVKKGQKYIDLGHFLAILGGFSKVFKTDFSVSHSYLTKSLGELGHEAYFYLTREHLCL